jgi:hypothetical protein
LVTAANVPRVDQSLGATIVMIDWERPSSRSSD